MKRYYRYVTLIPSFVGIVATLMYSVYANRNYTSEWMTKEGATGTEFLFALIYVIIICLLCLPILLVNFAMVRRSHILTFLSWFLLPVGFMATILIHEIHTQADFGSDSDSGLINYYILDLPFLMGLFWSYFSYLLKRKDL